MSAANDWFDMPFYRSLAEQILMLGVPKPIIVINAFIAFVFIINFGFWYILALTLVLHFGAIYAAKSDSQFFDCLKAYLNKKDYYCT